MVLVIEPCSRFSMKLLIHNFVVPWYRMWAVQLWYFCVEAHCVFIVNTYIQGHCICVLAGGKVLGLVVHTLKQKWAESDFSMSAEEMLQQLPYILSEVGVKPSRQVDWLQKCYVSGLKWKLRFCLCSVIQRLAVTCIANTSHIIWPFPALSCV